MLRFAPYLHCNTSYDTAVWHRTLYAEVRVTHSVHCVILCSQRTVLRPALQCNVCTLYCLFGNGPLCMACVWCEQLSVS
jgi:hypothetical protein